MLIIHSNNTDLSWILSKHPGRGMILRSIRQGVGQGWFYDNNTYCLNFLDGRKANSYSKDEFAYLDHSSISHPQMYIDLLNKLLASAIKQAHEKDNEDICEVKITNLDCYPALIENLLTLSQLTKDIDIQVEPLRWGVSLSIRGMGIRSTLIWTLAILFLAMPTNEYVEVAAINKTIHSISTIPIPYYLAFLIRNRLLRRGYNNTAMSNLLEILNKASNSILSNTSNLDVRINYVKGALGREPIVLDIGCGEGHYQFISKNYKYISIDKDPEVRNRFLHIAQRKQLEIQEPLRSLEEYQWSNEAHLILLTEVLEHNPLDEAINLLGQVLNKPQTSRVLITLPNRLFNVNFGIREYRHEDHYWEASPAIVNKLVTIAELLGYRAEVTGLGDLYEGQTMSIGIVFSRE